MNQTSLDPFLDNWVKVTLKGSHTLVGFLHKVPGEDPPIYFIFDDNGHRHFFNLLDVINIIHLYKVDPEV